MTPEERAYRLLCDGPGSPQEYERMATTGLSSPDMEGQPPGYWLVIWPELVATIRAAENDVLERAAQVTNADTWHDARIRQEIRALKHGA